MDANDTIFNPAYDAAYAAAETWCREQKEPVPSVDAVFAALDAAFPLLLAAIKTALKETA